MTSRSHSKTLTLTFLSSLISLGPASGMCPSERLFSRWSRGVPSLIKRGASRPGGIGLVRILRVFFRFAVIRRISTTHSGNYGPPTMSSALSQFAKRECCRRFAAANISIQGISSVSTSSSSSNQSMTTSYALNSMRMTIRSPSRAGSDRTRLTKRTPR